MKKLLLKASSFEKLAKQHHIGYHNDGGLVFEDTQHHFDSEAPLYICSICGGLDDLSEVSSKKPVREMVTYIAEVIMPFKIGNIVFNNGDIIKKVITTDYVNKFIYIHNEARLPIHIGHSIDTMIKNNSDYFKFEDLKPKF